MGSFWDERILERRKEGGFTSQMRRKQDGQDRDEVMSLVEERTFKNTGYFKL